MIDVYTASVIVFFAALGVLIYKDRKNIEHKYFIYFKRKTVHGEQMLDRIVSFSPTLWKVIGVIAVIWAFIAMAGGIIMLLQTVGIILSQQITEPGIKLLLPTPTAEPISGAGFIGIPFWFWIIIVAIAMAPHEIFHGIMARLDKIRVRSMGVFLLAIFPGAFVDPDEKQFNRARLYSKLRVIAAGTFANVLTSVIVLIIAMFLVWPIVVSPGAMVTSVNSTSPAAAAGLQEGMVIQEINGVPIVPSYQEYAGIYTSLLLSNPAAMDRLTQLVTLNSVGIELNKYSPGDTITVKADGNYLTMTLGSNPSRPQLAYMGISSDLVSGRGAGMTILMPLLTLIIFVSFIVALINMLPLGPLDGGVFLRSILERFIPSYAGQISMVVSYFVILLFVSSGFLPLLIAGA